MAATKKTEGLEANVLEDALIDHALVHLDQEFRDSRRGEARAHKNSHERTHGGSRGGTNANGVALDVLYGCDLCIGAKTASAECHANAIYTTHGQLRFPSMDT